ncbi:MAG TPA: hypothetical protein VJ745_06030, partial [Gaiellaceae bacterium]|nr:hypothetical protein [Gaiellaceae bacterium]
LEAALEAFPGTVLIVSHDRALLDAVPDRIVAIEDDTLRSYDGGWADKAASSPPSPDPEPEPEPPGEKPVKARGSKLRRKPGPPSELERVEAEIAAVELRIVQLEGRLAGDWNDMDVLTAHRAARDELQELLLRWEVLFEDASTR